MGKNLLHAIMDTGMLSGVLLGLRCIYKPTNLADSSQVRPYWHCLYTPRGVEAALPGAVTNNCRTTVQAYVKRDGLQKLVRGI